MIKKHLLHGRILAASLLLCSLTAPAFAGQVTLEDNDLMVAFDSDSGALTRMEAKTTDHNSNWIIERRPELANSFRLFAPLPDRRWNPVYGQKQRAIEVKKISDHTVELQWKNLVSENGGTLPITLTSRVTLNNGVLTFNATLQNDSPLTVETIDYPYFGDFNRPASDSSLVAVIMQRGSLRNLKTDELYPHFNNEKGYWGDFYPTKALEAWDSPFCLIQAPYQGLYVQMDNSKSKYRLEWTFEQHPGLLSSITQLVPPGDDLCGTPVHMEFRVCHFVFTHGHSMATLAPVIMRCYNGGTRAGEEFYRQWRSNR